MKKILIGFTVLLFLCLIREGNAVDIMGTSPASETTGSTEETSPCGGLQGYLALMTGCTELPPDCVYFDATVKTVITGSNSYYCEIHANPTRWNSAYWGEKLVGIRSDNTTVELVDIDAPFANTLDFTYNVLNPADLIEEYKKLGIKYRSYGEQLSEIHFTNVGDGGTVYTVSTIDTIRTETPGTVEVIAEEGGVEPTLEEEPLLEPAEEGGVLGDSAPAVESSGSGTRLDTETVKTVCFCGDLLRCEDDICTLAEPGVDRCAATALTTCGSIHLGGSPSLAFSSSKDVSEVHYDNIQPASGRGCQLDPNSVPQGFNFMFGFVTLTGMVLASLRGKLKKK